MNELARTAVLGWQQAVNVAWERQQGMLTGAPGTRVPPPPPHTQRGLNPDEIDEARKVFGDTLDFSKIEVKDNGVVPDVALSTPGYITFPAGTLSHPGATYKSWLIHELTHQWQYQHGYNLADTGWNAVVVRDYDYGGDKGLQDAVTNGKPFKGFNTEEQGDIMRNYYKLLVGETPLPPGVSDISVYEPYVNSVRNGTAGLPPKR